MNLANKFVLIFQQFCTLNTFCVDWYLGTEPSLGETVTPIKKKKAGETQKKVSKEKKHCTSTAGSNYLDQPSQMNTPMKEKTNTKEYTSLSKCIFKGMV